MNGYMYMVRLKTITRCSLQQATEAALKAGHHVVVDNTNPGKKERKQYVDLAKKHSKQHTL